MNPATVANNEIDETARAGSEHPRPKLSHRILRGGAWSVLGRVGSMGCFFLTQVLVARFAATEYAAFLAATSLVPLLAMLATMGVPFTLVRALRGQTGAAPNEAVVFRGALTLTVVGCVATGLVYCLAAPLLPDGPKWFVLRELPGQTTAWFALSALCFVCASFLQGVDDFRNSMLVGARNGGLIPNGLTTAAVAALAALSALSLSAIVLAHALTFAAALVFGLAVIGGQLRRKSGTGVAPESEGRLTPSYSARWFFLESWPNLFNQVIAVALVELDLLWIVYLADEQTVASYGVGRTLRLLVSAPLLVASVALAPFVAELFAKGDNARLERMLRGTATLLAAPSLVALVALLAFPEAIIQLTVGAQYLDAALAVRIASLGCIVYVLSGNNGLTLTMTGRHRDLLVCSVVSLGLYLLISPTMVARYGVTGAATAFAIQMAFQNVITTLRVKQTTGMWTIPLCSPAAVREEYVRLRRGLRRGGGP
jgi:O-antigen/teichoic acid export membrane protein